MFWRKSFVLIGLFASASCYATPSSTLPQRLGSVVTHQKAADSYVTKKMPMEVVFENGASVLLAPNSRVSIVSDGSAENGIKLWLTAGAMKVTTGTLNQATRLIPLKFGTPVGSGSLDVGSAIVRIKESGKVDAALLYGEGLYMSNGVSEKSLVRNGFAFLDSSRASNLDEYVERVGEKQLSELLATFNAQGGANEASESVVAAGGQQVEENKQDQNSFLQSGLRSDNQELASSSSSRTVEQNTPQAPNPINNIDIKPITPVNISANGSLGPGSLAQGGAITPPNLNADLISLTDSSGGVLRLIVAGQTTSRVFNDSTGGRTNLELSAGAIPQQLFPNTSFLYNAIDSVFAIYSKRPQDDPSAGSYAGLGGYTGNIISAYDQASLVSSHNVSDAMIHFPSIGWAETLSTNVTSTSCPSGVILDHSITNPADACRTSYRSYVGAVLLSGYQANKVVATTGSDGMQVTSSLIRNADSFIMQDSTMLANGGENTVPHVIVAMGTLSPDLTPRFSIDRFFVSAGLTNFTQIDQPGKTVSDGVRAFMPSSSVNNMAVVDSGLWVINRATKGEFNTINSESFHVDLGISGGEENQLSTISVTVGGIQYYNPLDGFGNQAIFRGRTIGSYHSAGSAATSYISDWRSTSFGGGNHRLNDFQDASQPKLGQVGYLVLENNPDLIKGGSEKIVGSNSENNFSLLRLASGKDRVTPGVRDNLNMNGWAAGLVETNVSGNVAIGIFNSGNSFSNFNIQSNRETNSVQMITNLNINNNGDKTYVLGGFDKLSEGTSAFADNNNFAARTSDSSASAYGTDLALVTAEPVKSALSSHGWNTPDYKYVKWGFFLGELNTESHVHMGFWVAGEAPKASEIPLTGTATYFGHVAANVYSQGAEYSQVGSFTQNWDLSKRSGTTMVNFDGQKLEGDARIVAGTAQFVGNLHGADREGNVVGQFVKGGGDPIAAVAGRLEISGKSDYVASGVFAGERK